MAHFHHFSISCHTVRQVKQQQIAFASNNSQGALFHVIEQCRKTPDKSGKVGIVLTDLSKVPNCIPHDLLLAKFEAYGFGLDSLNLMHSYLRRKRWNFPDDNTTYSCHDGIENILRSFKGAINNAAYNAAEWFTDSRMTTNSDKIQACFELVLQGTKLKYYARLS